MVDVALWRLDSQYLLELDGVLNQLSHFIVGLTGGIASGKSTVAELFKALGVVIVDADVIAREVVAPGTVCLAAIVDRFGPKILTADQQLNRPLLRELIFSDLTEKQWLNALMHPHIRTQMQLQCEQAQSVYVMLVMPLLVENNLLSLVQHILVVDVDEQTQIQRTMARDDVSAEQVRNILASQATRQQRLAVANDVIVNDLATDKLQHQVNNLHQKYLQLAK